MQTTTTGRLVLAGTLVALLAACGGQQPGETGRQGESIQLPGGDETAATTAGGGGQSAGGPSVQPGTPGASLEIGIDKNKLRLDVESLKRGDGGLVTARYKITNVEGDNFYATSSWGDASGTIDKVFLVDPVGQKKYLPVKDSEKDCLCSEPGSVGKGATLSLYATFPPIPPSVTTVTVSFPGFPPIEHVALGS